MKRWLKKVRPVKSRSRLKKLPARRLGGQQLETRQLMAADVGVVDTTLAIQGSAMDDIAEVYVESGRVQVTVSSYDDAGEVVSEKSDNFAVEDIDRIVFEGLAGDDLLVNDSAIDTVARGGGGNDILMGGSGSNLLIGGVGDDLFLGGGGTIMVLAGPGSDVALDALAPSVETVDPTDSAEPVENADETEVVDSAGAEVEGTPSDSDVVVDESDAHESEDTECLLDDSLTTNESSPEVIDAEFVADETASAGETTSNDEIAGNQPVAEVLVETPVEEVPTEATEVSPESDVVDAEPEAVGSDAEPVAEIDVEPEPLPEPTQEVASESVPTDVDPVENDEVEASEPTVQVVDVPAVDEPVDQVPHQGAECLDEVVVDDGVVTAEPEVLAENENVEPEQTGEEAVNEETVEETAEPETDNDVIFGGSGDDWLLGEGGNDLIFGNTSPLDDELLRSVISGRLQL